MGGARAHSGNTSETDASSAHIDIYVVMIMYSNTCLWEIAVKGRKFIINILFNFFYFFIIS